MGRPRRDRPRAAGQAATGARTRAPCPGFHGLPCRIVWPVGVEPVGDRPQRPALGAPPGHDRGQVGVRSLGPRLGDLAGPPCGLRVGVAGRAMAPGRVGRDLPTGSGGTSGGSRDATPVPPSIGVGGDRASLNRRSDRAIARAGSGRSARRPVSTSVSARRTTAPAYGGRRSHPGDRAAGRRWPLPGPLARPSRVRPSPAGPSSGP
jgi:hypothetical protein